ncbi:hypothetical protein AUR04nite_20830 [Glutamicibacter uratoxydans]|uniref:Uncharacterized protein n=1 Tax=Glutamicibacter uratoxydans TaxID=43667 RepID=A0A4Y4DVW6_GLUUR|nr:hypothetical protein AUR04nite_20830 [Glutamicibacter uratoxydans]
MAIANGADLESRNAQGMTPLLACTKSGQTDAALELIRAGSDVNAKDHIKDSTYLYAGARGMSEILEASLQAGADIYSTNRYGGTALIPASERGLVDTVERLLDAGLEVNHVNKLNWTALIEAIILGDGSERYVRTVQLLLERGADPLLADGEGCTPQELAVSHGHTKLVEVLNRFL